MSSKKRSIYHRGLSNLCERLCTAIQENDLKSLQKHLQNAQEEQDGILLAFATAVQNGNVDVVRIFVETGHVGIDDPDLMFGETALMHAVRHGNLSIVKYLLEAGADINAKSSQTGDTALHICVGGQKSPENNTEILQYLVKRSNVNLDILNQNGDSPLIKASFLRKSEEIKQLLDANCKIDFFHHSKGLCSVHFCLSSGYFPSNVSTIADCFRVYLDYGIDPDFKDQRGVPLIGYALHTGNYKVLCLLLYVNCDVNILYPDLSSPEVTDTKPPIVYACIRKEPRFIKALLASGCDRRNFTSILHESLGGNKDWLDFCSSPRTLKETCRITIRKLLGYYPHKVIDKIGVPKMIQKYILLNDVVHDIELKM